ncbi:MAG: GNAT family N-acetyltransferase [Planctomycetota bacterium]|nr:GNAT family N-acetyltransferase [Planctomycetota bacterium]
MQFRVSSINDLTAEDFDSWLRVLQDNPQLDSPYLHPEFTKCVAAVRPDVEVTVAEVNGRTVGFFPFQRIARRVGRPVGGRLNDCHCLIASPELRWDLQDVMHASRLTSWDFHYLPADRPQFQDHIERRFDCAYIDVSHGYEQYIENLDSKRVVKESARKSRGLEREFGKLRFEWHSHDKQAFETLRQWKSEQYQRSDIADVFSFPWTLELLRELGSRSGEEFEGLFSTLHAGDRIIAVHFGMRAGRVLHHWFPAYDPELRKFSPGLMHALAIAEAAPQHGIERIDLGEVCDYKSRIMSGSNPFVAGSIDLDTVRRLLRSGYQRTREWVKNSPLRGPARLPGRWLRQLTEWWEFR